MKLVISLILSLLFSTSLLFSVSAFPGALTFTQNDGTQFEGKLTGDEWLHYVSLPNEFVAIYDKDDKSYNYALISEDNLGNKVLVSSDIKVSENLHLKNPQDLAKSVPSLNRISLSKLHRNKPTPKQKPVKKQDNNNTKDTKVKHTKSSIWKEVLKEKKEPLQK